MFHKKHYTGIYLTEGAIKMKKRIIKTVTCLSMSAVLVISGVFTNASDMSAASKAKKIIMNKSALTMKTGETFKLKVKKVNPANLGKAVSYSSSKKSVAVVSVKGVVKAKKAGKANITVTSKKNKAVKTTVTVKVKKADTGNTIEPDIVNTPVPSGTPAPTVSPKPEETPAPTNTPDADNSSKFNNIPEMYGDIISSKFSLGLSQYSTIALDLKDCSILSDSDKQALVGMISEKYGKETVLKTKDELTEEGKIVQDSTYGFVFSDGALITIKEVKSESRELTFYIGYTHSGLNGIFFDGCTATQNDNLWTYKLGRKGIS